MGLPSLTKAENGPAYTGKGFDAFCKEFGIQLKTGVPDDPMGQGTVEHANST